MEFDYDIIMIGKGVAAQVLLFEMARSHPHLKILGLHAPKIAAPCSLATTSVISENGITKNNSQLGDWFYDSYHKAKEFILAESPAGVAPCTHYHIRFGWEETSKKKLIRRFGHSQSLENIPEILYKSPADSLIIKEDAFCINAEEFLQWLDQSNAASFHSLNWIEAFVSKVDGSKVTILDEKSYTAQKIIFATGAAKDLLSHNRVKPFSKRVPGSFLQVNFDLGQASFILSFTGFNFIYRHRDQKLLIGGTNQKDGVSAIDWVTLQKFYKLVSLVIPKIPAFREWIAHAGVRQKGQYRLPFWGPVPQNPQQYWEISSLYKNGFTLPFLAAKDFVRDLDF